MNRKRTIKAGQARPGSRRTPLITTHFDPSTGALYERDSSVHGSTPIDQMFQPARCRGCGAVYDLGHVTVTARYADCSMWNAPCCGRQADSRHAWSGIAGEHMGYTDIREANEARDKRWKEATR